MTTPESATSEPTERSIPWVRITKVIPMAMMPWVEDCNRIFSRLNRVRNTGDAMEKNTPMLRRPQKTMNSLFE